MLVLNERYSIHSYVNIYIISTIRHPMHIQPVHLSSALYMEHPYLANNHVLPKFSTVSITCTSTLFIFLQERAASGKKTQCLVLAALGPTLSLAVSSNDNGTNTTTLGTPHPKHVAFWRIFLAFGAWAHQCVGVEQRYALNHPVLFICCSRRSLTSGGTTWRGATTSCTSPTISPKDDCVVYLEQGCTKLLSF